MTILKFACTSDEYPVFRDYKTILVKHKTKKYQCKAMKDALGGTVKMELIDPTADPLIDETAEPLETVSLENVADEYHYLKMAYKPTKNMEAIMRISVIKNGLNVYFKTTRLEQML
jgi:hypothetical protein